MSASTQFWNWFDSKKNEFYYFENNQDALFEMLTGELKKIHEDLTFQFSPVQDDGRREFCISAGGIKEAFGAVKELVAAAPTFKEWFITAFRQRVSGDDLAIHMGDFNLGYADMYFLYAEEDNKLDIQLHIRNFDSEQQHQISAAFILLDALLGEYDMETYIGHIEWVPLQGNRIDELMPLVELRDLVDQKK